MAASIGVQGQVVSWAGTFNSAMLALFKPAAFTITQQAQEFDTTGYNSSNQAIASDYLKGLRQWSGSIEGFNATPVNGVAASISGTAYSANARAWGIDIECDAKDTTAWSVTNYWRTFKPGLQRWSGFYECLVDDTTATTPVLGSADATAEPLSATFTLVSGNTWAGSIFTTGAQITSRVGDMNVVRYTFRGSSNLTVAGSAAFVPANSGTMVAMVAGSLILEADDGVTYTGSAFPTRLSVGVAVGDVTRCSVSLQGTGAIVHAVS